MFSIEAFRHTLAKAVQIFTALGIRFHLTGDITAVFYGERSLSQVFSIVVGNSAISTRLNEFLELLATLRGTGGQSGAAGPGLDRAGGTGRTAGVVRGVGSVQLVARRQQHAICHAGSRDAYQSLRRTPACLRHESCSARRTYKGQCGATGLD